MNEDSLLFLSLWIEKRIYNFVNAIYCQKLKHE